MVGDWPGQAMSWQEKAKAMGGTDNKNMFIASIQKEEGL